MGVVDFKYLKERVGIDDVAYSLGYRIDRSAGVGKYVEMVLSDGRNNCMDRIIISHPGDKGNSTIFTGPVEAAAVSWTLSRKTSGSS